jgi:hypothetical protein
MKYVTKSSSGALANAPCDAYSLVITKSFLTEFNTVSSTIQHANILFGC